MQHKNSAVRSFTISDRFSEAMILVLAYGNSLRRDDGAGFALGRILDGLLTEAGLEVKRLESHQLTPELALDIAEANVTAVFFVDTRVVSNPGEGGGVRATEVVPADIAVPGVGHHLDPSVLLAYTKHLFKKDPPAWLLTVPGSDFDHGEGFSEATQKVLDESPEHLRGFVALAARRFGAAA